MTTQRTPAHPADSAEALLREAVEHLLHLIGPEYRPESLIGINIASVRAALQASDSRVPTDSQRDDLVAACYEANIHSRGDLVLRFKQLEAERLAPSPAAETERERNDRQAQGLIDSWGTQDFWTGEVDNPRRAAAEGSEPLDGPCPICGHRFVDRGNYAEHQRGSEEAVAYASQTGNGQ